ncbi:MAG: FecR family protein, partial [Acidobacteria bacterium]|nr:FecR family protein [Acidobacteriota bacterium]
MKTTRLALFILGISLGSNLPAQPEQPEDGASDRGVARISVLNGDVSVRRGDSGDWVAAALNAPLMVNDAIFAGPGSRAEVQFDNANMVRLGSDSEVRMGELDNQRYLVQVARGVATFRVLRESSADVEISTQSISVRPRGRGSYRIEVQEDGTTMITVRSGQAEIFTPQGSQALGAGRTMMVRGTAADPEFQVVTANAADDWDGWNDHRDRELEQSRSYQYVSNDISGAEDLDGYGNWESDASYGSVWYPRVAASWSPYREGRWVWMDFYGWTWVSYDPWGWAPYHYGRWFHGDRGWGWWPGGRGRNHWSPALVAFVGFGGGRGGYGRMGWVPLAPHEPFNRWWGGGRGRGGDAFGHNVNIRDTYRNSRVSNGMMAMNAGEFGRGRAGNFQSVRGDEMQRAQVVRGQHPVVPNRDSMRMADRAVRTQNLPRDSGTQRFFSRQQSARSGYGGAGNSGSPANQGSSRGGWQRMGQNAPGGAMGGSTPGNTRMNEG